MMISGWNAKYSTKQLHLQGRPKPPMSHVCIAMAPHTFQRTFTIITVICRTLSNEGNAIPHSQFHSPNASPALENRTYQSGNYRFMQLTTPHIFFAGALD